MQCSESLGGAAHGSPKANERALAFPAGWTAPDPFLAPAAQPFPRGVNARRAASVVRFDEHGESLAVPQPPKEATVSVRIRSGSATGLLAAALGAAAWLGLRDRASSARLARLTATGAAGSASAFTFLVHAARQAICMTPSRGLREPPGRVEGSGT